MESIIKSLKSTIAYVFASALLLGISMNAIAVNKYSVATGNWNATTTWSLSSGGSSGAAVPVAGDAVIIEGGYTVTVNANTAALLSLTISLGSTLSISANFTVSSTTLTVNGIYTNNSTGTLTVTNLAVNGTWNHNTSSATLPKGSSTTTWASGSNLNITGSYTSATVFINFIGQTFGNVSFNPSSMTNTVCLFGASGSVTVNNFTIVQTGTSTLYMRQSGQQFVGVLNINGNLTISAGIFDMHNGGATPTISALNLKGNFTLSGTSVLKQTTTQSGSTVSFNFTGTTTQVVTISPTASITSQATTASCAIQFNVASGATIDMGTSVLTGTNNTSFTLSAGAGIITANTGGLSASGATGSIQVAGPRSYSTNANYTYNSTIAGQVTGNGVTAANNLTISNTNGSGVTFSNAISISGNMAVTTGAHVNLGAFTSSIASLTLGGVAQTGGTSYGGSTSAASVINSTYFNTATGVVNVNLAAPSNLSYSSPFSFPVGVTITPQYPTVTGSVASYAILPDLTTNTGLAFDTSTGAITGTPAASPSVNYTVTATNSAGNTTCTVVISVGDYRYAVANGVWNVTSTWAATSGGTAGATVPVSGTIVFIGEASTSRTVTIPTGYAAVCGSLTMGNYSAATTATLSFTDGTSTLAVSNDLVMNRPNATATTAVNVNAGSLTVGGKLMLANSDLTPNSSATLINQVNITTGSVTTHDLMFNGQAAAQSAVVFTGAGTLTIGGDLTFGYILGTLTPSTGTVIFNGAVQTVPYVSSVTYNNLTLSGSGTKTLAAAMTSVNNLTLSGTVTASTAANLTVSGILTVGAGTTFATGINFTLGVTGATSVTGTFTLAGTGTKTFTGDVTVNSGGNWNETGIAAINYAGSLANNGATLTALSGVHTFTGAAKTISGTSEISIPNVTVTSPGTYANSGTLTVNTALSGTGILTNGTTGTLNLGGTSGITTLTTTATGNTVNYTGAAQTVRNNNYYHLTLSGSGTDVLQTGTTAIGGNLTLIGTVNTTTVVGLAITGNLNIGNSTTFTAAGFALTVTGTTTVGGGASGNLTISSATGAKLFTGLVTIASGATWNNSGNSDLEFRGSITATPAFTGGSGVHTFTTNAQALTGTFTIPSVTVTGITLTNNNSLTVATALSGTGGLTQAANANLLIGGTAGITTLTATATDNLVNYYGGVQTVQANTYYNLTLSGTGAKTTTSVTVNNILSMEGTTAAASALPTYGASAILQYKGSAAQVAGAEFPASITAGQLAGIRIENTLGVTLNTAKDIGTRYLTIGSIVTNSIFNDGGFQLSATGGTLNLTSGTFKLGASAATTFPGFTTNNITDGTTVDYAATAAQTVKGATGDGFIYSNLTLSGTGNKTADGNITVNGILNLTSNASTTYGCLEMVTSYGSYPGTGTPNTGPYTKAEITSHTLTMGASATTTGTGDVTGIVKRNTIVTNTPYSFGQQFTTVTFSGGTMPTPVSVIITIGTASLGKTGGVQRTYEVVPTGGSGGTVAANFHYLTSEKNGNTDAKMVTWDYDIGGGTAAPDEHGRSVYDITTNYYIGLANIPLLYFQQSYRTIFTMGDAIAGVETWLTDAATTAWETGSNWSSGSAPVATDHVIIPGGCTRYPILPSDVTINSISFGSGASLVMGSYKMTIQNSLSGGWDDQNPTGNDPGTSTVIFTRPGTTISGYARFYNVEIYSDASYIGSITNQAGSTVNIENSITRTGLFTGKWYADVYDNNVEYSKSGAQTVLLPDGSAGYHNLTLSGTGTNGKTLPSSAMAVHGSFTLSGTASTEALGALTISGNVTLGSGTTFNASTFTHSIAGNWTTATGATFTPGTSTIAFNNTSTAQAINGSATAQTFNNITVAKTAQTLSVGGSTTTLTLNGGLTITSGTFDVGTAGTVNVAGNWSNSGTFTSGSSGMVSFDGASTQAITGANTFNNLTIYKTSSGQGVTAGANQTVNGILYLNSPNHSGTQGCLSITDPSQLYMGPSATTTGTGDVSGYITRTSFALSTTYTFGNPYTLMNFTVGPLPTSVSVEVYLANPSWKSNAINRYYDVTQTGGTADTRLRFNTHYLNSELNGNTDGNLDLFDNHETGPYAGLTHDHGRTDFSNASGAEWVGFSNVGLVFLGVATPDDHLWTLGNNTTGNTTTWIGGSPSGVTDWNLPGNWEGGVPEATSNVIIPTGSMYYPLLPDATTTIYTLTIQSGAIVNANVGTPTLTIAGSSGAWDNLGTFNRGNSTVIFTGTAAMIANTTNFHNVTIADGKKLTLQINSIMRIEGTLSLSGTGVLDATANINTVVYSGAGQTVINPNGTISGYYNLILSGSGNKTMPGASLAILGNLTLSDNVTATPANAVTVSGTTALSGSSNFILGASEILSNSSAVIFNGGIFTTGAAAGFTETVGILYLTDNSTIALGTGNHALTFAASDGAGWTSGKMLTITGWTGSWNGTTGTAGKIFAGSSGSGLTVEQLAQIRFYNGSAYFSPVILSSGEVVPSASGIWTWTGATSNVWSLVDNWSPASIPPSDAALIIPDVTIKPVITSGITCNNLTINSGGVLTVSSTGSLIAGGTITNSDPSGFVIQSDASGNGKLLYNGTSTYGKVELWLADGEDPDHFHFIVPPVSSMSIGSTISSARTAFENLHFYGDLLSYNESLASAITNKDLGWAYFDGYTTDSYATYQNSPFQYLYSSQGYNIHYHGTSSFSGALNTGQHSFTLSKTGFGWNLAGNPYPCNYDIKGIGNLASGTGVESAVYVNSGGIYAACNINTGANTNWPSAWGSTTSNIIIPPMQGFFVHATTDAASLILPVGFKSTTSSLSIAKGGSSTEASTIQIIKLALSNSTEKDETAVCLIDKATTGFDGAFDAYKLFGNNSTAPGIYTEFGSVKYAINSLPVPTTVPVRIPVTIVLKSQGTYKIDVTQFENLGATSVILRHGINQTNLNLTRSYSFTSAAGTFNDFELIFGAGTTGIEKPRAVDLKLTTWYSNNYLYINCPADVTAGKSTLTVYDMHGKPVYQNTQMYLTPGQTIQLPLNITNGVYVTQIVADNKRFVSKIVVF